MKILAKFFLLLATFAMSVGIAYAQAAVTVVDAWVRSTVPEQHATGAFMRLTAAASTRLVGASSTAAKVVEVHEMAMQNDVMKMRQVDAIALPAGTPVELKPGGYHIMLMQLTRQIKAGDTVPVTLIFEDSARQRSEITVQAQARALATPAAPAAGHAGMQHQH